MVTLPEIKIVPSIDQDEVNDWLRTLRLRAYVPGSGYKIAAVFAMKRKSDFVMAGGVNVECFDHRLNSHAETAAISMLATVFGKAMVLDEGWTLGAPGTLTGPSDDPLGDKPGATCGACRQHINEFARHADMTVSSLALNGQRQSDSLASLLPHSFSFSNFDPAVFQAKIDAQTKGSDLDLTAIHRQVVRHGTLNEKQVLHWLQSLESIDYASGLDYSVILRLSNGDYVAGVKVENAAYVGTSAVQSALANAVTMYGSIEVAEIYAHGRRIGAAPDLVYPVPLSGLQGLNEFVAIDQRKIPVTLFTQEGDSITIGLGQATGLSTSFAHPAYRLRGGTLSPAV